jgi:hypothetical protein
MKKKLSARPNGSGWDEKAVSQRFLATAENAEGYLTEVRTKVKRNRGYERVYDETLARFYVFNRIAVSASLTTRQYLLSELKSMTKNPPALEENAPYSGAYNAQRFAEFYRKCASELFEEFSDTAPD